MFKTAIFIVSLFFIALSANAVSPSEATPVTNFSFTNLQNNERLEISLSSRGCFHSETGNIIVTSGLASVGERIRILSPDELSSLDKYIKYVDNLNEETDGWCTSTTNFTLSLYRNDKLVSRKDMFDFTCQFGSKDLTVSGLFYALTNEEGGEGLKNEKPSDVIEHVFDLE